MAKTMNISEALSSIKRCMVSINDIADEIELSQEFKALVNNKLGMLFLHSYLKCRRGFLAIEILNNSDDQLKCAYTEAFPLVRVMAESYFHFCYITDETEEPEKKLSEYEKMKILAIQDMLKYTKVEYGENPSVGRNYVASLKRIEVEIPEYLEYVSQLARRTGNSNLYKHVYKKYNNFIHFSPLMYSVYGVFENGGFTINKHVRSERLEGELLFYSTDIMVKLIWKAISFVNYPVNQAMVEAINEWFEMRQAIQIAIMHTE
ncbi:DUF5677 domain-containing protein [Brevibacillus gelatini]